MLATRLLDEIGAARRAANVSQRTIATQLGWSHARYGRFERDRSGAASLADLSAVAALPGLELGAGLHAVGDAIRDKGHQALVGRFRRQLSAEWHVIAEVPLPNASDGRSWDLGLRLAMQRVGVEAETRIRDVQRLVRRVRARERDGGMDEVLLLIADTSANRRLLPELLEALGPRFSTSPRALLAALRAGEPLPGSGVVLI